MFRLELLEEGRWNIFKNIVTPIFSKFKKVPNFCTKKKKKKTSTEIYLSRKSDTVSLARVKEIINALPNQIHNSIRKKNDNL